MQLNLLRFFNDIYLLLLLRVYCLLERSQLKWVNLLQRSSGRQLSGVRIFGRADLHEINDFRMRTLQSNGDDLLLHGRYVWWLQVLLHQVCPSLIYNHFLNDRLDYISIRSSALFILPVLKDPRQLQEYLFEAVFSFFLFALTHKVWSDDVNVYQVVDECFNFGIVLMDAVKLSIVVHDCINEQLAYGKEAGGASQALGSVVAVEAYCLV